MDLKNKDIMEEPKWMIYIPEEGHWEIDVDEDATYEEAKAAYLKWAGRKRLPKGSLIEKLF